jgi:hypothetical protein
MKIPIEYIINIIQPIDRNIPKIKDLLTFDYAAAFQSCKPEAPPAKPAVPPAASSTR